MSADPDDDDYDRTIEFRTCEVCDKIYKHEVEVVFVGEYKWGTGEMHCRKCILENDQIKWGFRYDGRWQYYDFDWLFRFRNPHGHEIFNRCDVVNCREEYDTLNENDINSILNAVEQYSRDHPTKVKVKTDIIKRIPKS